LPSILPEDGLKLGTRSLTQGPLEDIPDPNLLWFVYKESLFQKAHILKAWFLAGGAILGGGRNFRR
jgi:hypothetical protein